jgi:hypothetical protein
MAYDGPDGGACDAWRREVACRLGISVFFGLFVDFVSRDNVDLVGI